jgi:NAD(P)H-dependent flavin oxidoreductase YrpB (nitropropane dioxygenase family)
LAAALALGACGINMGTRFMCTVESPVHLNVKKAITEASEGDTELLLRKWKNTNRLFKNEVAKEAKKIETQQPNSEFKDVQQLVAGQRGKQVFLTGDVNAGVSSYSLRRRIGCNLLTCFYRYGPLALFWASSKIFQLARLSSNALNVKHLRR